MPASPKVQVLSDARAKEFIALYNDHSLSMDVIAQRMGWETQYPRQRVQSTLKRLRERGYDIPPRGQAMIVHETTLEEAQQRLDTVTNALRQKGFRIIFHEGRLRAAK